MKRIITSLSLLVALAFVLSGCGQKNTVPQAGQNVNQGDVKKEEAKKEEPKSNDITDVCSYLPKELVESAIGRPIVKTDSPMLSDPSCNYYTEYSETYDHTPYGDKPGGPKIVVVYDTKDFAKDRVTNEKHDSKYESDPSIGMDNFVVRNNVNEIWLVALSLGDEKYIRMKAFDDAVAGEELVKIGQKFAEKIKSGN